MLTWRYVDGRQLERSWSAHRVADIHSSQIHGFGILIMDFKPIIIVPEFIPVDGIVYRKRLGNTKLGWRVIDSISMVINRSIVVPAILLTNVIRCHGIVFHQLAAYLSGYGRAVKRISTHGIAISAVVIH